ncbi:MAG: hypothetical protein ACOX8P_05415 [Tepidanaerobacteraceae bacterium]|jgi:hypothetical protein
MFRDSIKELIERSYIVEKYLTKTGGNSLPIFNTISGSEFEEWLADIKAVVTQLKVDSLTQSIIDLTNSFTGWSDEVNFEKLVAALKSLHKNQDFYFNEKATVMAKSQE